ncbi:hypothetical protein EJ03DRAFT_326829 [Teratosphaeria nubilosa]|uniref:Uncharacterized protein n=1 Tax=Teratosphaeria nubilosa TaxID=161662 RepID=A0A6G1LCN5_9PEZI|nr:hypothetical protein EJ03DRAFT_326829 [Teratosphaeria nubilosa]
MYIPLTLLHPPLHPPNQLPLKTSRPSIHLTKPAPSKYQPRIREKSPLIPPLTSSTAQKKTRESSQTSYPTLPYHG